MKHCIDTSSSSTFTIEQYAFDGSSLKNIVFPDRKSVVNSYAFNGCTSLELISITATSSTNIPDIHSYAFYGMASNGIISAVTSDMKTSIEASEWLYTSTYYPGYFGWTVEVRE